MAPAVIEKVDGREVACLQVGPPGLTLTTSPPPAPIRSEAERWEVEFTLTTEGSFRLGMLCRDAGPDGVVAILGDGQVVSVSNLADGPRVHRDRLRR